MRSQGCGGSDDKKEKKIVVEEEECSTVDPHAESKETQEAEYRECFDLFAKGEGTDAMVCTKDLGSALVELGLMDAADMAEGAEGAENWDMDIDFEVSAY